MQPIDCFNLFMAWLAVTACLAACSQPVPSLAAVTACLAAATRQTEAQVLAEMVTNLLRDRISLFSEQSVYLVFLWCGLTQRVGLTQRAEPELRPEDLWSISGHF